MHKTALLIVDVQQGMDAPELGKRNNPDAESNIAMLLAEWRNRSAPVIHVKHNSTEPASPLRPGLPGNEIKESIKPLPGEKLFEKTVNSAFIGTGLEQYLHANEIHNLVIVGLTTDHCVSTTVRMAANLGFRVWLVEDATATFDRQGYDDQHYTAEQMHEINLASLNQEFCTIIKTSEALERAQ